MATGELSINSGQGTQETSSPRLRMDLGGEFSYLWGEASPSALSSDGELKLVTVTAPWGGSSKALRFRFGGQTRQHLMGRDIGATGRGFFRSGLGVRYDDGSFIYIAPGSYKVSTRKSNGTLSDVFEVGEEIEIGISGGVSGQYVRIYDLPLDGFDASDISDPVFEEDWQLAFSGTNAPTWFPKAGARFVWNVLPPRGDRLLRVQVYTSSARTGHPYAVAYARYRVT